MYAREVDDKALTLVVSGMLWNRSLVMQDKETGSLWSHLLGEAMQGPLKGKRLEQVPSVMTDWETWRKQHPDGTVVMLSRTSREYTRQFYQRPERFVLGVLAGGSSRAWAFDVLMKEPALNDRVGSTDVLVTFDKRSATARLYERKLQDQVLTFRLKEGKLMDQPTGSTWDPLTGRAVAGPHEGKHLKALPAVVSYRQAWQQFHPRSEIRSAR